MPSRFGSFRGAPSARRAVWRKRRRRRRGRAPCPIFIALREAAHPQWYRRIFDSRRETARTEAERPRPDVPRDRPAPPPSPPPGAPRWCSPALHFAGAASIGDLALRVGAVLAARGRRAASSRAAPRSLRGSDARPRVRALAAAAGAPWRVCSTRSRTSSPSRAASRVSAAPRGGRRTIPPPAARAVTLCADAGAVGVGRRRRGRAPPSAEGVPRAGPAARGAPDPRGRSGGGAVAVASRAAGVDFALGTDASGHASACPRRSPGATASARRRAR